MLPIYFSISLALVSSFLNTCAFHKRHILASSLRAFIMAKPGWPTFSTVSHLFWIEWAKSLLLKQRLSNLKGQGPRFRDLDSLSKGKWSDVGRARQGTWWDWKFCSQRGVYRNLSNLNISGAFRRFVQEKVPLIWIAGSNNQASLMKALNFLTPIVQTIILINILIPCVIMVLRMCWPNWDILVYVVPLNSYLFLKKTLHYYAPILHVLNSKDNEFTSISCLFFDVTVSFCYILFFKRKRSTCRHMLFL